MKNYTITVNGNAYDVTVEENGASSTQRAKVATPVASPKAAPAKAAQTGTQGAVKVNAPMPGKILSVKANEGQAVKKGEVMLLLEAMKMENEVVAPQDGTIASINVAAGDMVEAGAILVTLN
ncbi:MAG: biotin/lipoyl-containing protein [Velocimicrobium sp.]